jgi:hypothetical protein
LTQVTSYTTRNNQQCHVTLYNVSSLGSWTSVSILESKYLSQKNKDYIKASLTTNDLRNQGYNCELRNRCASTVCWEIDVYVFFTFNWHTHTHTHIIIIYFIAVFLRHAAWLVSFSTKCCLFHDFIFFCSNKMFFLINHALRFKHQPRHSNVNKCQKKCVHQQNFSQWTIFTANPKLNPICPQIPSCNSSMRLRLKHA